MSRKTLLLSLLSIIFVCFLQKANAHEHCTSCQKISFIQNKKQWDARIQFKAEIKGGEILAEKTRFIYLLYNQADLQHMSDVHHAKKKIDPNNPADFAFHYHVLKANFLNANQQCKISTVDKLTEYFNFFLGKNPENWAGNVPAFKKIIYENLYQGINVEVYSADGLPKYDYVLQPNANPNQIQLQLEGADAINIKNENLVIETSVGAVTELKPYAYQIVNGSKIEVPCKYVLKNNVVSFDFPKGYDATRKLIIDPTLIFSTYSGSFLDNFGYTATYDSRGNAFAAGSVFGWSSGFYPTTPGAYQTSWAGGVGAGSLWGTDMGITKYDSAGLNRVYSTYLGGNGDDLPHSMVVNSNDELIVFGTTGSSNFPTTSNAFGTTFNGGVNPGAFNGIGVHYLAGSDIVITRFNFNGTGLLGSTYVGGSGNDGLNYPTAQFLNYNYADEMRGEVDVDENDNIIVATCTNSPNFPTTANAYQQAYNGGNMDGCVFKLNGTLSQLIWSTYLGGNLDDAAYSIAFDKNKDVIVCGGTRSTNFPTTTGSYQPAFAGGRCDGFIAKLNPFGQSLLNSTFYGSNTYDQTYFVETNKQNEIYVFGQTSVTDSTFIFNSTYNQPRSGQFVSKFNENLTTRIWSNVFGRGLSRPDISPTAFLVDLCNKIYISGWGSDFSSFGGPALGTTGLGVSGNAYQSTTDGNDFYLMVMEDGGLLQNYATYFGSPNAEEHVDGGTSRFDKKGVCYQSVCAGCGGVSTFPTFPSNTVSTTNNSLNCNNAIFKFDFDLPFIKADFIAPNSICLPATITLQDISKSYATTTYSWTFGNGQTSTVRNPTVTYTQPGLYTIQLAIRDTQSCNLVDTIQKTILILSSNKDTLADKVICRGGTVQIGLPPISNPSISFSWTPNIALSDTNISNPFASPDSTIEYQLIVNNSVCLDTFYQKVIVFETNFKLITDTIFCPNDTVHLGVININNIPYVSYQWQPTSLIYGSSNVTTINGFTPRDTTFTVKMTGGGIGCDVTLKVPVNVIQDTLLIADFTAPTTACAPATISFVNTSTVFNNTTYLWSFGDNTTSTIKNPSHTYTNPGVYTIKLVVKDVLNCNQKDSITKQITIIDTKKDTLPTMVLCLNLSAQIGITPYPTSSGITYTWLPNQYLNSNTIANPTTTPQHSTNYVLLIDNGICIDTFTQKILVFNDEIKIGHDSFPCPTDSIHLFALSNLPNQSLNYTWLPQNLITAGQGTSMATAIPNIDTVFKLFVTNAAGCLYVDSTKVTVTRDRSVIADFDQPISGCFPHFIRLQNNSTVVGAPVYNWNFGDNTTSTLLNPTHTYNAAGAYTIMLIVYDSLAYCQPSDTFQETVTVFANQSVQVLPNDSICPNSSIEIGNIVGIDTLATLSWTPNYFLSDDSILNPIASPLVDTTYLLKVERNGCVFYYQKRIVLLKDAISLIGDTAVCPGDTLRLHVKNNILSLPLAYHWSPLSLILADSLSANPLIKTNRDTTFVVIGTNRFGCSYTTNIRVHALTEKVINADFTPPNAGCAPYTANFVNTSYFLPSTTFEWHFGDGTISTLQNPNHLYPTGGVFDVTLILKDSLSCNLADTVTKRILILDSKKDSLPTKLICTNQTVKLGIDSLSNTNLTFEWTPSSFLNSTTIANPTANPTTSINYILVVKNGICIDTFFQSVILFNDAFTLSQDSIVCPQDTFHTIVVNTTGQSNVSYQWRPLNYIVSGANATVATVRVPKDTFIYITISNTLGCVYTDSVAVQVLDEEVARADFNAPLFGCAPFTAQFLSSSYVKFAPKYFWNFGDNSAPSTINNPIHTYQNVGTYTVTLILYDSTFTCTQRDTIQKVITIQNNFEVDTLPTLTRCKNTPIQIGVSPVPNTTYSWDTKNGLNDSTIANPICSIDTDITYKLTVTASNCVRYYYQKIKVIQDSLWITKQDPSCSSGTVILDANTLTNHSSWTFDWSPASEIISGLNTDKVTLQPSQNIQVFLEATDTYGCKYRDTTYAAISSSIGAIDATANPTTIRYLDTSQLDISPIDPSVSYFWDADPTLSSSSIRNPRAFPLQTTTYYARVSDTLGCYKTDTVTVHVYRTPCPDAVYFVPNAFTPNNDGKNDILYVRGYNIVSIHFIVFDRWGQKMFETTDITKGWDGSYKGSRLDPSVFAYIVEGICVGGEAFLKKGNVTILK